MTKTENIIHAAKEIIGDNYLIANAKKLPGATDSYGINARKLYRLKKALEINSANCTCDGWGCLKCCTSPEEVRQMQGAPR